MPFRGRVFTLQTAIENQRGRLVVDGGPWLISGPDCPPGTAVRIVGVEGARLKVVPDKPANSAAREELRAADSDRTLKDQ